MNDIVAGEDAATEKLTVLSCRDVDTKCERAVFQKDLTKNRLLLICAIVRNRQHALAEG